MRQRIYRSNDSKVIGGVCGGLAEYFDIDPTWIRLLFILTLFAEGVGLIAYIIAWIVIPVRPFASVPTDADAGTDAAASPEAPHAAPSARVANGKSERHGVGFWPGIILIGLGMVFLFDHLFFWFDFTRLWPVVIISFGVILIYRAAKSKNGREEAPVVKTHEVDVQHGDVVNDR